MERRGGNIIRLVTPIDALAKVSEARIVKTDVQPIEVREPHVIVSPLNDPDAGKPFPENIDIKIPPSEIDIPVPKRK